MAKIIITIIMILQLLISQYSWAVGGINLHQSKVKDKPTSEKIIVNKKHIQTKHSYNTLLAANASNNDSKTSPKNSNANNYKLPFAIAVNPQTGKLSIHYKAAKLPGYSGLSLDLGVTYHGESKHNVLGLPEGWQYSIPYIANDNGQFALHMADGKRRILDSKWYNKNNYHSGLLYYNQENLSFKDNCSKTIEVKGLTIAYRYQLKKLNGITEYFDEDGLLRAKINRFGDSIVYNYKDNPGHAPGPYSSLLANIIDSYNHTINVSKNSQGIHMILPDHRSITFSISGYRLVSIINPLNESTNIHYKNYGPSEIHFPNGLITRLGYDKTLPVHIKNNNNIVTRFLPIINSMKEYPQGDLTPENQIIKTYYYYRTNDSYNTPNYTGYPNYSLSNIDQLLQSNNNGYEYQTMQTTASKVMITTYNHFHLPTQVLTCLLDASHSSANCGDDSDSLLIKKQILYAGTKKAGDLPAFNQLPANFETPTQIDVYHYNPKNHHYRLKRVATKFNDLGLPINVDTYRSGNNNQPQLVNEKSYKYAQNEDLSGDYLNIGYGQVIQSSNHDYITNEITQTNFTLNKDKKTVATQVIGEVVNDKFKPIKKIKFSYHQHGRIKAQTLSWADSKTHSEPLQSQISYTYAQDENIPYHLVVTKKDPLGHISTQTIDTRNGNIIQLTDAFNNIIKKSYDNLGRLKLIIYPDNIKLKYDYTDAALASFNHLPANQVTETFTKGYKKIKYINGLGKVVAIQDNAGLNSAGRIDKQTLRTLTTNTYNNLGELVSKSDLLANITSYSYDALGRNIKTIDTYGNITKMNYLDDQQKAQKYFNGLLREEIIMNDQGKPVAKNQFAIEDSSQNVKAQHLSAKYDGQGQVIEMQYSLQNSQNNNNQILGTQTYSYDISGKLKTKSFVSDFNNKLSSKKLPYHINLSVKVDRDLLGDIITSQHTLNDTTVKGYTYKYNANGNLVEIDNKQGQHEKYTYDKNNNKKTSTDFSGTVITYHYNKINQLTDSTYQGTNPLTGQTHNYDLHYDYNSQRKIAASCLGVVDMPTLLLKCDSSRLTEKTIAYKYTFSGLTQSIIYPADRSLTYSYDKYSRLKSIKDYAGVVSSYSYYDKSDKNRHGLLANIGNSFASASFDYYTKNDILSHQSGKIKSLSLSNGLKANYNYNPFGRILNITYRTNKINAPNNIVSSFNYTYDDLGNIQKEKVSSLTDTSLESNYIKQYQYNGLKQLISSTLTNLGSKKIKETDYLYDASNNVSKETIQCGTIGTCQPNVTLYKYNLDNQLKSITDNKRLTKFNYDLNGNLKNDELGGKYVYNKQNQLLEYTNSDSQSYKYQYYSNGLRASKSDGVNTIAYYYDDNKNAVLVNAKSNLGEFSTYLQAGAMRLARKVDDKVSFYLADHKDIRGLINDKGVTHYNYSPYGVLEKFSKTPSKPNRNYVILPIKNAVDLRINPFIFSGQYRDMESGNDYLRVRYYRPTLKQFISQDSYNLFNRYAYANNNPIMNMDPSGHDADAAIFWSTTAAATFISIFSLGVLSELGAMAGAALAAQQATEAAMAAVRTAVKLVTMAVNLAVSTGINASAGAIQNGGKGAMQAAGFSNYGAGFVANVAGTAAWAGINLFKKVETASRGLLGLQRDVDAGATPLNNIIRFGQRLLPFVAEGVVAWAGARITTLIYNGAQGKISWSDGDYIDFATSLLSGIAWDGVTESLPLASESTHNNQFFSSRFLKGLIQSAGHAAWGGAVNMAVNSAVNATNGKNDSQSAFQASLQNSIMFSAIFATAPEPF